MMSPELRASLPSTEELPCSDDTPVDNEEQNFLPNLLLFMLMKIWAERMDWFFAVDMALYHTTGANPRIPVVPDAFLSLGVDRRKGGKSRRSYATWEENDVVPILALEMVSHKPGGEYTDKMAIYTNLGVLYYVIYNPEFYRRDRHSPFEVYKLTNGSYQLQTGEPFWMPEVGIGIGRNQQTIDLYPEVLCWFDAQGNPYLTSDQIQEQLEQQVTELQNQLVEQQQRAEAERQRAEAERQSKERLAEYLRSLGIDPDNLPN